jgi:hypothetical protein
MTPGFPQFLPYCNSPKHLDDIEFVPSGHVDNDQTPVKLMQLHPHLSEVH